MGQAAPRQREMADQAAGLAVGARERTWLVERPAQRGREMLVVPSTGLAVTPRRLALVVVLVLLVVMLPRTPAARAAMAPRRQLPDQQLRGAAAVEAANVRKADQAAVAARVAAVRGRRITQISQPPVARTPAEAVVAVAGRVPAAAVVQAV